jgi:hypothetical protein
VFSHAYKSPLLQLCSYILCCIYNAKKEYELRTLHHGNMSGIIGFVV